MSQAVMVPSAGSIAAAIENLRRHRDGLVAEAARSQRVISAIEAWSGVGVALAPPTPDVHLLDLGGVPRAAVDAMHADLMERMERLEGLIRSVAGDRADRIAPALDAPAPDTPAPVAGAPDPVPATGRRRGRPRRVRDPSLSAPAAAPVAGAVPPVAVETMDAGAGTAFDGADPAHPPVPSTTDHAPPPSAEVVPEAPAAPSVTVPEPNPAATPSVVAFPKTEGAFESEANLKGLDNAIRTALGGTWDIFVTPVMVWEINPSVRTKMLSILPKERFDHAARIEYLSRYLASREGLWEADGKGSYKRLGDD